MTPESGENDPRECGWFGCGHPRCSQVCEGVPLDEWRQWRATNTPTRLDQYRGGVMGPEKDQIAQVVREVLADHIWTPRKKGPAECWSANDRECGQRFTTGGEYRAHVAALVAERLITPPASTTHKEA